MNKYVAVLVAAMVVTAVGGQGVIRLLIDHGHAGLMGWLPGGFVGWLLGYLGLIVIGVLTAGWADTRRKKVDAG